MKNVFKIFMLLGAILMVSPAADAQLSVGLSVRIAPPPLPVYEQPECPVDGYLWQPGYWAYDPDGGYYWVPGVWVAPPEHGYLWTPSYWGYDNGVYLYHHGYWGHHIGFYGGINYGFGYPGYGFYGGMWSGRSFRYNTAVFRVNRTVVRNVYVNRVVVRPTASRASFNGRGGIVARPRPEERRAMTERHIQPTRTQVSHQQMAGRNPAQRLSSNHGRPATPAMNRPANHSVSSPMNRPGANHGNPAQNHNPAINRKPAVGHAPAAHPAPQINRSSPAQHREVNKPEHAAPQRAPRTEPRPQAQPRPMEHHNAPAQHVTPQRAPRPEPRPQMQPRPEPRPQPRPQMQPRPQPQPRPQMQPRPQPQQRPMGGGGHEGGGGHGGGGEHHH